MEVAVVEQVLAPLVGPLVEVVMPISSGPGGQPSLVTALFTSPLAITSLNLMHLTSSGAFLTSTGLPARSSITTTFFPWLSSSFTFTLMYGSSMRHNSLNAWILNEWING